MKRTVFYIFAAFFIVLFLAPRGVCSESAGLLDHISRHEARICPTARALNSIPAKGTESGQNISLFSDTRLNAEAVSDRFKHQYPLLTNMSENRLLCGWEDDRNGDTEIWGQVMLSGGTISSNNQLLINDENFLSRSMAVFAVRDDGMIAAVWSDEAGDLWLGMYDSTFSSQNHPQKINDNVFANYTSYPDVACLSNNHIVVVWEDTRLGPVIYGQIFDENADPLGDNFRISPDESGRVYWSPSVVAGTNGQFAVVWEEIGGASGTVSLLLFDSEGLPSGIAINAADLASQDEDQYDPSLAGLGTVGYLVGWVDSRSGSEDVYVQIFDANGNRVESNMQISEGDSNHPSELDFAVSSLGNALAVWGNIDLRSEIVAQAFSSDGKMNGNNFVISDPLILGERFSPAVIFRNDLRAVVVFSDTRDGNINIYGQNINADYSLSGTNFKLSHASSGAQQNHSVIARMSGDDFGVAWSDYRNDAGDIYFQRGNNLGTLLGSNLKLNDDAGNALQADASLGSADNGRMIAAWVDGRTAGGLLNVNIFAQRISSEGQKIGANFRVNDDPAGSSNLQAEPDCDISASGKSVVVWRDGRNGGNDIYGQIYDAFGTADGANFQINQDDYSCYQPKTAVLNNDYFVVAWRIVNGARSFIKFRVYDPDGIPGDDALLIPLDTALNQQLDFDLAANPYFRVFTLAWINENNAVTEIYSMMIGLDGQALSPVKIISDFADMGFETISVDMDASNSYAVAWSDMRSGMRRSYIGYVEAGTTVFPNHLISENATAAREQEPSVALSGRSWYCSWSDNRNRGKGYDIYANSNLYNPTSADNDNDLPLPGAFELGQNYPNPFNPDTRIEFSLSQSIPEVTFEVVNILGQTVHREIMTNLDAGYHEIEFNGQKLSSGIYFYRLNSGEISITRKMVLMK